MRRGGWKPDRIGLSLTGLGVLSSLVQEKQDEYDSSPASGGCRGGCGGRLSLCLHPQNRGRTPGCVLQVSGVCGGSGCARTPGRVASAASGEPSPVRGRDFRPGSGGRGRLWQSTLQLLVLCVFCAEVESLPIPCKLDFCRKK